MHTDITALCHKWEVYVSHNVGRAQLPTNEIINATLVLHTATSQHNSRSTVANANSNVSVAGGLAASSLPHMHIVYPLHNNIDILIWGNDEFTIIGKVQWTGESEHHWKVQWAGESELEFGEQFTDWIEHIIMICDNKYDNMLICDKLYDVVVLCWAIYKTAN